MLARLLLIDPLRTESTKKIGRFNDYQQLGTAQALVDAGADVTIGVFNDDIEIPGFKKVNIINAENLDSFDIVILTGFSANFFGGVEIKSVTNTYRLLANFKGKLLYYFTDLYVVLSDISKRIVEDETFSFYGRDAEDFRIKKTDVIMHSFNEKLSKESAKKSIKGVPVNNLYNYPIQASSFYNKEDSEVALDPSDIYGREYDLFYSSFSIRGHRRDQKILDYYFDNGLKTMFVGKAKLEDFRSYNYNQHPEFFGKIPEEEFLKIHRKSLATVVVADKGYYNHFFAKRIIEGIISQQVVFIDEEYDKNHILMPHTFFYVKNIEEVRQRIDNLRKMPEAHRLVIDMQNKLFEKYFSKQAFLEATKKLLKEITEERW